MNDTAYSRQNNVDPPKKEDLNKSKSNTEGSKFECYICLDVAKDAVVSMCGHLFCWPCLHQWLDAKPNRQLCPVCKSAISADKVIPLYGRSGCEKDPREKVPPRPQGQRSEETSNNIPNSGFYWGGENGHGGVQFSLGIGVFPLSIFAAFFNNSGFFNGTATNAQRNNSPPNSQQRTEEQFLSNIFFIIGIFFIVWLLLI